ncbi:unnamed protein product [Penicillium bialowiezense]
MFILFGERPVSPHFRSSTDSQLGNFVQEFTGIVGHASTGIPKTDKTLSQFCLFIFALFIARFGLASIQKFALRMIATRLHYIRHLFDQSVRVLDSLPSTHPVGTTTSGSNILQTGIVEKLGIFIECTALIIAGSIVSLGLSLLTLAGFVGDTLVVGSLFSITVKGRTRRVKLDSQVASIASESFSGIRMIMACGAQQQIVEKYGAVVKQAKKQAQHTNPITSLQFSSTSFGVFGIITLAYWYGTWTFIKGQLGNLAIITV